MSTASQEQERGAIARQRVHQMSVSEAFQGLTHQERLYAHHMSRAAWHGARIILRQVSEESAPIFDLILEIHNALSGDWQSLAARAKIDVREAESFLEFSSSFLSDIGNYSRRGDSKITPNVSSDCMDRIASISQRATELWAQIGGRLLSKPPFSLGFPSETTTSAYYPGPSRITKDEVSMVSRVMEQHHIFPENTRLRKTEVDNTTVYDILQASVETDPEPRLLPNDVPDATVRLVRGDHAKELSLICAHLSEAAKYAANPRQQAIISQYCESFQSGDLEIYRDSLREWVADRAPRVENIFGFVEPYRDPHGVRAEWEALVAIPNAEETKALTKLVQHSKTFIRRLPWANNEEFTVSTGVVLPLMTLVFGSLSETLGDFATGRLSKSQFENEFSTFALYYIYLGVGQFVVTTVYTIVFTHIGNKVVSRTREIYLRTLLHQPMKFYDEKGAGEITAGLSVDFNVIQTAISNVIPEIIANVASFVAGVAIMFGESWKLALVALSVIVAVILAGAAPARLVTRESARAADAISASAGVAEESISSIRTTLAFGLQEPLISRFDIHQLKAQVASTKAKQGIEFIIAAVTGLLGLGYGLIFWQGSRFLVRGDITMARLVSVIYALIISTLSISTLPPRLDKLAVAKTAASNVFLIIQSSPPSYFVRCGSRPEKDWDGSVTFQDVSLAYPSRPDVTIMKGFSAHITAGKATAIVGSSGSGKSSIISLLERFYDPSGGVILVDGRNILDLDLKWLRQRISLVEQQPVLFKTTIRQNILYGLVGTGHEGSADVEQRMIWAAQVANAHKFISDLPDGYDTEVGEKGHSLSGGQRQRIAIARAIIRDPRLLLLDEATSALDTESETVVQAALDNASEGRTTVVVAHRLSTIRNADNIIVVSNGSIVEQGSHDNLMARERTYFRMVHNQKMMAQEQYAANIPDDDITEPSNLRWSGNKELPELLPPATSQNEAEPAPVSPPARSVLKLAKFVSNFNKPESHLVALGACTAILAGSAHPVQGIFFAKCIASLAKPPSEFAQLRRDIDFWCSMYLWFAFFVFTVRLASQWSLAISSGRLLRRVRLTAFRSILRQDFEFFDMNAVGSLVSFLETQTEHLAGISGSSFGLILTSITVLVAAVSVAVAITWKLGLVWASTMPILLFSGYFRFYVVKRAEKNIGSAFDESAGLACEAVSSIRTVFSLTREEDIVDEYRRQLSVQGGNAVRMNIFSSLLYATSQGLPFLCMAFGFYYGSRLLAAQEINVFQFFVAFSQITFGADQAGVIFSQSPDIGRAMSAATYLKALFDRRPRIDLEAGNPNLPINSGGGSLEFRNVSFTYPGRTEPAVRNLNIKVGPGKKIAFVGESGCGKSTALSLIERFYIPSSGQILINGEDISKINVQTYRAYMALVDQVPMLYRGTMKENLVFGLKRSVSDAVIFQACRDANIYEFIVSLPDGFDTAVGSKGVLMSGGQKQRICIARAILRQPKILLLDEATSALDSESEILVSAALERATEHRTTISIAHRLSTIQDADTIYVFDKGRIIEEGTHSQLLMLRGKYFSLAEGQQL